MIKTFSPDNAQNENVKFLARCPSGEKAHTIPYRISALEDEFDSVLTTGLGTQGKRDLDEYRDLKVRLYWDIKGLGRLYVLSP